VTDYYTRSDLKSFSSHSFRDGKSVVEAFAFTDTVPIAPRHLVPLLFVLSLVTSGAAALLYTPAIWVFCSIAGVYLAVAFAASAHIALKRKDWLLLPTMPLIFVDLHFSYAAGSMAGLVKLLLSRRFRARLGERFARS
jgi:hypothetical protein